METSLKIRKDLRHRIAFALWSFRSYKRLYGEKPDAHEYGILRGLWQALSIVEENLKSQEK